MSAPDTNIEKQEKRHWPSLFGMGAAVLFGMLMGALITIYALREDAGSGATAYEGAGVEVEEMTPATGAEGIVTGD